MKSNAAQTGVTAATTHALGWIFIANAVGLWMAVLLLFPQLGLLTGEWTYGRWVPVHLNVHLYGWISLPLVGALLNVYRVQGTAAEGYARSMVWLWSLGLGVGCLSWLTGVSSGKVFLDWRGIACYLFVAVLFGLWVLLTLAWWQRRWESGSKLKLLGLLGLLPVPITLYLATRPDIYPPVNPSTGGPTGTSLLGSTLSIIFLLLILPQMGGCEKRKGCGFWMKICWGVFVLEAMLVLWMGQGNRSHEDMRQILGLGSLMVWIPLVPVYLQRWSWRGGMTGWRMSTVVWLALLIFSGWATFLPGWLDHLKFTNGLVAHSHLAMAGFCTSFLMLLMGQILPENWGRVLTRRREFILWQAALVGYVLLMWYSGWREGNDAGFVMMQESGMHAVYGLRVVCGLLMLWASWCWWSGFLKLTNDNE
jgi:cytochrome c oxidase cbb3-type subunit 1